MRNLLFNISYNGAKYHGYQVQANAITVAEVLQNAIEKTIKIREDIIGCSRTDTKVHANNYYFNMKTECTILPYAFVRALNCVLPSDISVNSCIEVPLEFHSRYSCRGKEYIYKIWNSEIKNPFFQETALQYRYPLDVEKLNSACKAFIGMHDFKAFCARSSDEKKGRQIDTVRTIYDFSVSRDSGYDGKMVTITVSGDGFLYNMIRIMVGTLLWIAEKRIAPNAINDIILSKNRSLAGKTARPDGLYLNRVFYDEKVKLTQFGKE